MIAPGEFNCIPQCGEARQATFLALYEADDVLAVYFLVHLGTAILTVSLCSCGFYASRLEALEYVLKLPKLDAIAIKNNHHHLDSRRTYKAR